MAHLKSKFETLFSFSTLFFFFFIFSVLSYGVYGQVRDDYMLKLLNALTPTPSGWSNKTQWCQWSGVHCDYLGYVDAIMLQPSMPSRSLRGTIPSGLNSLSRLTQLDLRENSLSGPLPSLANLSLLQNVNLNSNNFTSIPEGCFQGLGSLQALILRNNTNLAPWMFPMDLTNSSQLGVLDLEATNLMGSLPDIFHHFPMLQTVMLSANNITGILPNSFARSKVVGLYLSKQVGYNKLSGTIEVISSMTQLLYVELQGNRFEGPIPDLSNCTNLNDLRLEDNLLSGVVPPSVMTLPSLATVHLDGNFLQGPVPVFKERESMDVSLGINTTNGFCLDHVGPCDKRVTALLEIAAAFGYPILLARSWRRNNPCQNWSFITCNGSKIRTVNLTKQNLTGRISSAFGNLTDLRHLYLGGNNLMGSIPESLTTLPQLEVLDVSNNNLSGNIPRFSPRVRFIHIGNVLLGLSHANGTTHSPSPAASKASFSRRWIAGALVATVGVIAIFVLVFYNRKRILSIVQKMMFKKTTFANHNVEDFINSYGLLALKQYTYSEVTRMSSSFREKLGQGGYGTVYKASLIDGHQVAVKVLSESKGSGEDFINEVASISRTSHVNIVSLLGFCYEMSKRALIYEFMPNGSLDKFIYKEGSPNAICNLDWNTLYQITIGIARGLQYLHRECNTRILHLDIKPQNILLDEDFCPKISDFGLAKICNKKESIVSILGPRGTPGYIAPEIFSRTYGGVSHKSDVYSYGMLILEVVGGRKNYDTGGSYTSEMYFPDWIYKDLEQGSIPARCLVGTEEENDMVMKITLVSLWCIQTHPSCRPSMSKVVEMLEGPLQSVSFPPKPVLYSPERPRLQFSDISHSSIHETDSITIQENGSIT